MVLNAWSTEIFSNEDRSSASDPIPDMHYMRSRSEVSTELAVVVRCSAVYNVIHV